MDFLNQNILSTRQFVRDDVEKVLQVAKELEPIAMKQKTSDLLKGKVLATLFYEPSTRTRLSTETAMLRLGGQVVNVVGMDNSSVKKGETLYDTGKMVSNYADVIAMRHPEPFSVEALSKGADVPVINCGDGPHQHPTQSLIDMYTMKEETGKLDGLTIAMVGDLKFGRTVHSLCYLLGYYKVKIVMVAPPELTMPDEVLDFLKEKGVEFEETESLERALEVSEVIYATRIQEERFKDKEEYERLKGTYILSREVVERSKQSPVILHPLPRVDEIHPDVDELPGAAYFRQAGNGVTVRMAVMALVLGKA